MSRCLRRAQLLRSATVLALVASLLAGCAITDGAKNIGENRRGAQKREAAGEE